MILRNTSTNQYINNNIYQSNNQSTYLSIYPSIYPPETLANLVIDRASFGRNGPVIRNRSEGACGARGEVRHVQGISDEDFRPDGCPADLRPGTERGLNEMSNIDPY